MLKSYHPAAPHCSAIALSGNRNYGKTVITSVNFVMSMCKKKTRKDNLAFGSHGNLNCIAIVIWELCVFLNKLHSTKNNIGELNRLSTCCCTQRNLHGNWNSQSQNSRPSCLHLKTFLLNSNLYEQDLDMHDHLTSNLSVWTHCCELLRHMANCIACQKCLQTVVLDTAASLQSCARKLQETGTQG